MKAIKIVLGEPVSGLPSALFNSTAALRSSTSEDIRTDPIIPNTLHQSQPYAPESPFPPTRTDHSTGHVWLSSTNNRSVPSEGTIVSPPNGSRPPSVSSSKSSTEDALGASVHQLNNQGTASPILAPSATVAVSSAPFDLEAVIPPTLEPESCV
ncbi:hypothetical protein BDV93DRAFT_564891 [Ceratobasidium sp. AG-I]|nr:hypothetical protein BDV93DRAFT_564891 [Ceratobasidium sp. AG-I]